MTLPPPPSAPQESLPLGLSVLVREIAVEGNTVLKPEVLGQVLASGILHVRIIEGHLGDVVIRGQRGYRADYLRGHLLGEVERPLNAFELEERLRALEAEKGIQSLRATLRPGAIRDRAVLRVEVSETTRLRATRDRTPVGI